MQELSIFLDESGSDGLKDRYYLLVLVAHDQSDSIVENILLYEQSLRSKGLPDIAFHASPLMNGHGEYEDYDLAKRKQMLSSFRVFFRHMPVKYHCITLKTSDYKTVEKLIVAMRRQLVDFIFGHLEYFQGFESVKIYYDNGQKSIANAVHKAIDYALSKEAVTYRAASPEDYRLSQVADYLCTMELTALKYNDGMATSTDEKFFGSWNLFKKGIFKEMRRKAL